MGVVYITLPIDPSKKSTIHFMYTGEYTNNLMYPSWVPQ